MKKISNVLYDHWKIIFSLALPFIATSLFLFWFKFRDLMIIMIPFWMLFICLFLLGVLIVFVIVLLNKNKNLLKKIETSVEIEEAILINNLIYKANDPTQAFCPECFEKDKKFNRMKRYYREDEDEYLYECFVCGYREIIPFSKEKNPDPEVKIPF